ncbi:DUF3343 domain-containing protein [Caminicella sporogenes]|uniref:DUF3343 domain-containing protein n=1 Tax=Caminicella sporogenes TaxID=166485 RepID=UPI0025411336|nr:DUF3343 domain-containing protein [Caminicella sporogenes]WIF94839.1 DUF3343 domain-containing protein [Caminicella sporogenes]
MIAGQNAKYYLIVFNSKNHAYYLESILKKSGYNPKLINVPKYLSKHCSLGLIIYDEDIVKFSIEKIEEKKLDIYKVYKYCFKNRKKIYEVIYKS